MKKSRASGSPGATLPAPASLSMSSASEESMEPLLLLPPDGGYGWVVVVACFMMNLFTDGAICTFGFYQRSVQEDFGKESAEVAMLAALCSGFYNVAAPLWSAVGNRFGFRAVGVIGALASAGASVACFYISGFALYTFVYGVILGAGSGAVYMATTISVGFYFERWRGVATSITSCGSGIGVLVLPMCYKALANVDGYTWRWLLLFNAAVFVVVLVLALLLKPLEPVAMSQLRGERTVRFEDETEARGPSTSRASKALRALRGKKAVASSHILRQLHASQTSFAPSVAAPQFDAISMTSRAFPRSGPDARDMQAGARPMYRDDIFYGASASRLSSQMSTRLATTTLPTVDAEGLLLGEQGEDGDRSPECCASCTRASRRACVACCQLCPHAVKSTLAALLHHSILTNSVFLVFAFTQACIMVGYFTPFLFSQDQAVKAGVSRYTAEWILPSIGMMNAIGRGLAGLLCEVPGVSALKLSCTSLTVASLVVAATCASASPAYQIFASSAYGLFIAPFIAMKSLILVDFLGIEKLTNSFGLLLMFQGIAVMVGPPMNGWVYDRTNSYQYVYIISGSLLFIASVTPYLMYPLSNYEKRKEMKQPYRRNS